MLAWVELTRLGARARPAIELALRDAEACGDAGWRDMLLGLLEQLPSGSAPWPGPRALLSVRLQARAASATLCSQTSYSPASRMEFRPFTGEPWPVIQCHPGSSVARKATQIIALYLLSWQVYI